MIRNLIFGSFLALHACSLRTAENFCSITVQPSRQQTSYELVQRNITKECLCNVACGAVCIVCSASLCIAYPLPTTGLASVGCIAALGCYRFKLSRFK